MALYILGVFLAVLVTTALVMHYGFEAAGALPDSSAAKSVTDREFFAIDYTFFLNLAFAAVGLGFLAWKAATSGLARRGSDDLGERILFWLAIAAFVWLAGGMALAWVVPA